MSLKKLLNIISHLSNRKGKRPWGYYEILSDTQNHKVKRIHIGIDKRLSLQRHKRRSEHWNVIQGEAVVTLGEKEIRLKKGDSVDVQANTWHRIANVGKEPLIFIEIQQGEYFGEDDIERKEDDFGRVK